AVRRHSAHGQGNATMQSVQWSVSWPLTLIRLAVPKIADSLSPPNAWTVFFTQSTLPGVPGRAGRKGARFRRISRPLQQVRDYSSRNRIRQLFSHNFAAITAPFTRRNAADLRQGRSHWGKTVIVFGPVTIHWGDSVNALNPDPGRGES